MKIVFLAILFLNVNIIYAQGLDIKGWNKAEWGMTISQIDLLFKNEIVTIKKMKNAAGYCTRSIPIYKINGKDYSILFFMDSLTNKLKQIVINSKEETQSAYKSSYENLEELLISKYGKPTYEKKKYGYLEPSGISIKQNWTFKTTKIELKYIKDSILNFLYLTYSKKEPGNENQI